MKRQAGAAGAQPLERVLPGAAGVGAGSAVDVADRRAASGGDQLSEKLFWSVESNLCRRGQYNGGYCETTICSPLNGGGHVMDGWITVTCSAGAQTGVPLFVPPQRASSGKHRATNGRKLNGAPRNLL